MKQPHEHIADVYKGRTGSPYEVFHKKRRALNSALIWGSLFVLFVVCGLAFGV